MPVISSIGNVLDFVVSTVKFPSIELCHFVGDPDKPFPDCMKSRKIHSPEGIINDIIVGYGEGMLRSTVQTAMASAND